MNRNKKRDIQRKVKEISQNNATKDRDSIVPTDLDSILEREQIDLRLVDEDFIRGALRKKGDDTEHSIDGVFLYNVSISEGRNHTIIINRELYEASRRRARFTIAHELGHYFLHGVSLDGRIVDPKFMSRTNDYSQSERVEEMEADQFAFELLMPEEDVHKIIRLFDKVMSFEYLIDFLAKLFDVSLNTARRRVNSLDRC